MDGTNLIGVGIDPSVDAVVRSVETTFREPDDVPIFEVTSTNGLEGAIPVEGFPGHLHGVAIVGGGRHRSTVKRRTCAHHSSEPSPTVFAWWS